LPNSPALAAGLQSQGLLELSQQLRSKTHYLQNQLRKGLKKSKVQEGEFLNEFSLRIPKMSEAEQKQVLLKAEKQNLLCGIFHPAPNGNTNECFLTLAITERHSQKELDRLANFLIENL
jgi:glycine cleavage system pyridoxal-binding protein P